MHNDLIELPAQREAVQKEQNLAKDQVKALSSRKQYLVCKRATLKKKGVAANWNKWKLSQATTGKPALNSIASSQSEEEVTNE